MAKILLLFCAVLFLAACDQPLTRQEVITGVKECIEAGLRPVILHHGWSFQQVQVNCELPEEK